MLIATSDSTQMVKDPFFKDALIRSIAEQSNCSTDQVTDVNITEAFDNVTNDNLSSSAAPRALRRSTVLVSYTITITVPADANAKATLVNALVNTLQSVDTTGWTVTLAKNLQTDEGGVLYEVLVVSVTKPVVTYSPDPPPPGISPKMAMIIIITSIMVALGCGLVGIFIGVLIYHRLRRRLFGLPEEEGGKMYDYYLSYAERHSLMFTQPRELARSIHDSMEYKGLNGYLSTSKETDEDQLRKLIANSAVLIVCLHDETVLSEACRLEWRLAEEAGLPALCVADLQNCNKKKMEAQIEELNEVGEYLMLNKWQYYVLSYRHNVFKSVANFVRHNSPTLFMLGTQTQIFEEVLPAA